MTLLQFESWQDALSNQARIFPEQQLPLPGFSAEDLPHEFRMVEVDGKKCIARKNVRKEYGENVDFEIETLLSSRFERIIKAAGDFGDEIMCHFDGYAEPGYTDPECGVICCADWNNKTYYDRSKGETVTTSDVPERVAKLLEKLGVALEWSDEWWDCTDCHKLVRCQPDGMDWRPSYAVLNDCEVVCHECIAKDPECYLEDLAGDESGIDCSVDLEEHGYLQVMEFSGYGWPEDKRLISAVLAEKRAEDYLFDNNDYSLWLPVSYRGRVREIIAAIEERDQDINDYLGDLHDALAVGEEE